MSQLIMQAHLLSARQGSFQRKHNFLALFAGVLCCSDAGIHAAVYAAHCRGCVFRAGDSLCEYGSASVGSVCFCDGTLVLRLKPHAVKHFAAGCA